MADRNSKWRMAEVVQNMQYSMVIVCFNTKFFFVICFYFLFFLLYCHEGNEEDNEKVVHVCIATHIGMRSKQWAKEDKGNAKRGQQEEDQVANHVTDNRSAY